MNLAGKFVFYNHVTSDGADDFCQYGEIVEQCGEFYVLIRWHRDYGDPSPHDAAMTLVPVEEMTVLPGEGQAWQVFPTRESLEAYKAHIRVRPFDEDEEEPAAGGTVVQMPQRTH